MQKRLSDRVTNDILTMIMIEKKFLPGENFAILCTGTSFCLLFKNPVISKALSTYYCTI